LNLKKNKEIFLYKKNLFFALAFSQKVYYKSFQKIITNTPKKLNGFLFKKILDKLNFFLKEKEE
jgi:hypothetical protein